MDDPAFFISGLRIALDRCFGKLSSAGDALNRVVMNGSRVAIDSFSSHVGRGSDAHSSVDADSTAFKTSLTFSISKLGSSVTCLCTGEGRSADAAAARTCHIFLSVKL